MGKYSIRPKCKCCEYEITSDMAYCLGGDWYCEDCEEEFFEICKKEFYTNCNYMEE